LHLISKTPIHPPLSIFHQAQQSSPIITVSLMTTTLVARGWISLYKFNRSLVFHTLVAWDFIPSQFEYWKLVLCAKSSRSLSSEGENVGEKIKMDFLNSIGVSSEKGGARDSQKLEIEN